MSDHMPEILTLRTRTLEIGYEAHGAVGGTPVVLLHGFPDDARAFDDVAPPLAAAGCRVLVPYLRGYGPTRFLDPNEPRMAQQAAIGQDLLEFMDALSLGPAALAGYDWGGRAACIAAILAPGRVRALVTIGGYNVQNTVTPAPPVSARAERSYWYQWYFNTERGRRGLDRTGATSAGSSGRNGRRPGDSNPRRSSVRRRPSTIPISYRW
jgi:pimeloyl-ACP methyl ester carboxylesterase